MMNRLIMEIENRFNTAFTKLSKMNVLKQLRDSKEIDKQLGVKANDLSDIQKVFAWRNKNFKNVSGGG